MSLRVKSSNHHLFCDDIVTNLRAISITGFIGHELNPKNAFNSKRAGMDTRKTSVLKHLENAMLQYLIEYFYTIQITQIAALHGDNPVEYKGFGYLCLPYKNRIAFFELMID